MSSQLKMLLAACIVTLGLVGSSMAQGFDWKGLLSGSEKAVSAYASLPTGDLSDATSFGGGLGFSGVYPWKYNIDGAIALDVMYWKGDANAMVLDWQAIGQYNILGKDAGLSPFALAGIGLGRRFAWGGGAYAFGALELGYTVGAGIHLGKLAVSAKYQTMSDWNWLSAGVALSF